MNNKNSYDPYEQLANAIVSRGRKNQAALETKEECLRFFRSGWFKALTEIDPEYLIKKLDEEVVR